LCMRTFEAVAMREGLEGVSEAQWLAMRKGMPVSQDEMLPTTPPDQWEGQKARGRQATRQRKPVVTNGKTSKRFTDESPVKSTESDGNFDASDLTVDSKGSDQGAGFNASNLEI